MRMNLQTTILLAVLLVLSCAGSGCHDPDADDEPAHAPEKQEVTTSIALSPAALADVKITLAKAETRSVGDAVSVLGDLRVNEDAYAEVASPVAARVVALHAAPGDVVKSGQALVDISSPELGAARGAYLSAQAHATTAQQSRDRKRALLADKIVAAREVQEADADATAAQAQLDAAATGLTSMGVSVKDISAQEGSASLTLRAPLAGTVLSRDAVRGASVLPERTLFRVADVTKLWLVAHAFERDAVRVKQNAKALVAFPSLPGRTFAASVALVGTEVDASSKTIPLRIVVDNADGALRPGMSGTALVTVGETTEQAVSVPATSVQRVGEAWAVFSPRPGAEGTFDVHVVQRGRELAGIVDVEGIAAGDVIVVDGAFLLKAEVEKRFGGGDHDED